MLFKNNQMHQVATLLDETYKHNSEVSAADFESVYTAMERYVESLVLAVSTVLIFI